MIETQRKCQHQLLDWILKKADPEEYCEIAKIVLQHEALSITLGALQEREKLISKIIDYCD